MGVIFTSLMVLAMVAVLATLVIGVFGMAQGGEFNKKYANKLMRMRVMLQGGALVLFVAAILAHQK